MNVCALIPSYDPDGRLISTVEELRAAGFRHIIVVDDGSRPECRPYFDALEPLDCEIIHLPHNSGKGEALKIGFLTFLIQGWTDAGVVTVDGDGQHSGRDALRCACELLRHPKSLILGGRDFSGSQVPARSKSGNQAMTLLLNRLCGITLRDTQTGLRAIPASCLAAFSGIPGGRYEYETNMLLYCKRHHIPMVEVPISTIYIDSNAGSHYHPVLDSLRIGLSLCRYFLAAAAGFLAGLAIFAYCMFCGTFFSLPAWVWIWLGAMSSCLVSGLIGFSAHHTDASQSGVDMQRESTRYSAVTALQGMLGGLLLSALHVTFPAVPLLLAKAAADCVLFPCFSRLQDHIAFSQALAEVRRVPVWK